MATISGKTGNVIFTTGYTTGVHEWSMEYNADALETTNWVSDSYKYYIPGLKSFTGQCQEIQKPFFSSKLVILPTLINLIINLRESFILVLQFTW